GPSGLGGASEHLAFHLAKPGRVDLWPAVPKPDDSEKQPWDDPLDRPSQSHEDIVLARAIAQEIRAMIDRGERIDTGAGPRAVHEGDFLILVRRRKLLFDALIRACKAQGLEVAGADRLTLGEELAVQDLIALLRFLALPEDSLSLAVALRSPLFGWSEDRLFRLAQGRGDRFLWEALRQDPAARDARAVLDDLRDQVDFLRPFELIERILTRHDGRHRIRARFGAEVDEALEAFVDLALSYEQGHIPSLDGFLGWLDASDAEVKRQTESAGRRVRVMTVHGAKGLEAPIVILPDTAARNPPGGASIIPVAGVPILRAPKAGATEAQIQADDASRLLRDEESDRLLYVALTRAESWLIVTGAGNVEADTSWYARIARGMQALATALGDGVRHEHGSWPPAAGSRDAPDAPAPQTPLALAPVPAAPGSRAAVSPSALGGAKAMPGDGAETDLALARGSAIHAALEVLPALPDDQRAAHARRLFAGLDPAEAELCLSDVTRVLDDPALAHVFRDEALKEVAVCGTWQGRPMWGVIDRLLIDDTRVLAIDFKSNRVVPADDTQVPEGLLRQMGAYAHLLRAIWPGRHVETALLWTADARLMPLSDAAGNAALARAALDPELAAS
ncbi:MAG: PD-(D/E)XK nuclease family protein, partial [Pararhodobacter sp.]|nr:PD-(D/E)XK nuclease family protein [Pararhodobacter sp.]